VFGASACTRVGGETKVAFGAGAQSFAWAWDTDHYVVVYPETSSGDIFAGVLAADGTAMGPAVDIQMTRAKGDLPSLLKTSNGFLVVWQEGSAGYAIYARALGRDAMPAGPGVALATTQLQQSRPVLAHAPGGHVAVTWMDRFADGTEGVLVARVDPSSLHVVGPERLGSPDVAGWPWMAGDDQTLAVVWSDQAAQPNGSLSYDIPFATIDAQSLQPSARMSLRGSGHARAGLPRMIRTDFGYLAAWEDMRGGDNAIFMALVDATGGHIGGGMVEEPNSGDANWPNMAWTGKSAAVVYYQWRDNRPQIFMSLVDAMGARAGGLNDLQVSAGTTGWSKYPDVLWTGNEFGVLYVDTRDGGPALWFRRISCRG
jgi:hypothetical protein